MILFVMKTYTNVMLNLPPRPKDTKGWIQPLKWLFAPCLICTNSLAHADLNDTFSPYVSAAYMYNSNLFLLPNDQAALATLGTTSTAESYQTYAAGVKMNWKLGRQFLTGHVEANRVNFDTYNQLDYNGHNYALKWDWLVDDILQGNVGTTEKLALAPFTYTRRPLANMITTRSVFFNGYIKLDNRWQLKLGAQKDQSSNSDNTQIFNDSDVNTYKTGFRYLTRKGSKIDFNSTVSNASYPTQPTPANSYTQYDNGIGFDWVATGKTRLEGKVNYTKRDYPNAPQQNYSGVTGRISADWLATGKTKFNLAVYRDIGSYITNTSTYDVTQGVSARATWAATSKISVDLSAQRDSVDFLNTPHRVDKVSSLDLGVTYTIFRNTRINFIAEKGVRSSNIEGNSYRYDSLMVGLNHAF